MSASVAGIRQTFERRAAVLACLREAGDARVSGQEIAESLGISRVAVSNHVAALREAGYEIESATRRGYRLLYSPDLPLPYEILPLIKRRVAQVVFVDVTGSTNDDAKELAHAGAPEGTVVFAVRQTKGKGRLGRSWSSPAGSLYASYVMRPEAQPVHVAALSLVVALGVVDALEAAGITGARLKWPNDVLLFDGEGHELGKAVGILLEMAAQIEQVESVVAGIGLNVNRPERLEQTHEAGRHAPAYLSDILASTPSLAELAAAQIDAVYARYNAWCNAGFSFAPFRADYERRLSLMGEEVTVSRIDGTRIATGVVQGVDDFGRLLLRAGDETVPVAAGEVTLRG